MAKKRLWPMLKRSWKRRRARIRRERSAARRRESKAPRKGSNDMTPQAVAPSLVEQFMTILNRLLATYRADSDEDDVDDLAHRNWLRRHDRRHHFTCTAHTPPQRFASAADLNQHLGQAHPEPVRHPRGTVARKPVRRRMPAPTRPPGPRRSGPSPPRDAEQAAGLDSKLHLIRLYMDKIKQEAVHNMGADTAAATLGDIGTMPITTVSQIREAMVALEAIGQAVEEAVTGFQQNARTSEQAPIKEEVLTQLTPAVDGAQQIVTAVTAFLSAFDDEYEPDIREAKAGERMDNPALTN